MNDSRDESRAPFDAHFLRSSAFEIRSMKTGMIGAAPRVTVA